MDVKNVELKQLEGDKLQVTIEVKQTGDRNPTKDRKFFTSKEVKKYLTSTGIKNLGKVVQDVKISNFQGAAAAVGTWVFLKKASKTVAKTTPSAKKSATTTSAKATTVKKTATK